MRRSSLVTSLVVLAAFAACAEGSDEHAPPPPPGAFSTDSGPIEEGGPACAACSTDLHQILDCATPPNILETCLGNTACGVGPANDAGVASLECIDTCQASAANKSSIGCDFYVVPPDASISGSCFAAFVNNTWDQPLKVTLEWKGQTIDATPFSYIPSGSGTNVAYNPVPSTGIPADQMAIVFLNSTTGSGQLPCPVQDANTSVARVKAAIETEDINLGGTGIGDALHLMTSLPAVVYDIYPYAGAESVISSATLLLPTPVWDTNYVGISPWSLGLHVPGAGAGFQIVSMTDGTEVTLLPTAPIAPGNLGNPLGSYNGVVGAPAGKPVSYTLYKGQVLQLTQDVDLSGTPIQASQPVGLWSDHQCMNIPVDKFACDAAHQQIPPVRALGSRYAAVPYRTRFADGTAETVPWRIMGLVAGTTLTYDPPVDGAPTSLGVGQVAELSSTAAFVVASQDAAHPFYLAEHMTGCAVVQGTGSACPGDPETVNVLPPDQFLSTYRFFTDFTYSETNLVLVRGPAKDGSYKDVRLDCLGDTPIPGWTAIGGSGLQLTRVDLQMRHAPVGACDNGLHTITSDAPFGLTVWGWDSTVSYAYPAGASVQPINGVVVTSTPVR